MCLSQKVNLESMQDHKSSNYPPFSCQTQMWPKAASTILITFEMPLNTKTIEINTN